MSGVVDPLTECATVTSVYRSLVAKAARAWFIVYSSRLAQDAGKLLFLQGTVLAIKFFASAHAMRSLGPEQLGIGAFVLSIVAQSAVLSDLGLTIAGVRAMVNRPKEREQILSLVWGIRLRVALALSVLILIGGILLSPVGRTPLWILATPLVILTAVNPQWVFQGIERVPALNTIALIRALATAACYFALFRPGACAELYVGVALAVQALGWAIAYVVLIRRFGLKCHWQDFEWRAAQEMLRESRYAFAIVLSIFVYTSLEIPLITFLLSPREAGVYRAAVGIRTVVDPFLAILPLLIYPRLIAWKNQSEEVFVRNSLRVILVLTGMAILVVVSAIVWVPLAFTILLGSEFEAGIWPCILLVLAKGVVLAGAVPGWGLLAWGLDRKQLVVALSTGIVSITLNFLLIPRFGIIAASSVNVLSELTVLVLSAVMLLAFLRCKQRPSDVLLGDMD